ncbi:MFS transporter, partial [bacterium]|nr:MFS transporter [bacterium]
VGLKFVRMGDGEQVSNSIMWLFVGYLFFSGPSTGAVIWVYISEIFPNRVRAKGQSLGSSTHWLMAAAVSQAFPVAAATKAVGPGKSFLFFAVCMLAQAVFVWKVLPETKGASLEQLQKRLGLQATVAQIAWLLAGIGLVTAVS